MKKDITVTLIPFRIAARVDRHKRMLYKQTMNKNYDIPLSTGIFVEQPQTKGTRQEMPNCSPQENGSIACSFPNQAELRPLST